MNEDLAPFDLALPGTQPQINKHAVLLAVRAALAFGCEINRASSFDRKHYFYPDQPAGYQITQNYNALAHKGSFSLSQRDGTEQEGVIDVGISQVQLEQDTAKTTYYDSPPQSLVDLNRNGTPLIEIVTTPSIPSAKAAGAALRKIQAILRAVEASDANMEAGGMRCDVNVSVTKEADAHLGPSRRVEIKNLASSRIVTEAVAAESARQISVLETGGSVGQETRGFDVESKKTFLTRTKESATDYRYMPEPDLGPLRITDAFLTNCRDRLPELPDAQLDRLMSKPYNLSVKDARVLMQDSTSLKFYQDVLERTGVDGKTPKVVCNWIVHELFGRQRVMEESGKIVHAVTKDQLSTLISMINNGSMNGSAGKIVLQAVLDGDTRPVEAIVESKGLLASSDLDGLKVTVANIISRNPTQGDKLRNGDVKIKKWFVGQVMRETQGYVQYMVSLRHQLIDLEEQSRQTLRRL